MVMPAVLKFGGACLLDPDDFSAVAAYVSGRLTGGRQAVLVVSAMSGTSGAIQELIVRLNSDPPPRAAAVALASADQLSAALLAITLSGVGINTCLLASNRTGLTAEGNALRGRLTSSDGQVLRDALRSHQIVVLPGGHGAAPDGSPMMLGRNSSDLSAAAVAVSVDATECEIFSDVAGIYTADPRIVPEARAVRHASYRLAADIAGSGAKVLHPQAIMLGARHGLRIVCRGRPPAATTLTTVSQTGGWQPAVVADTHGSVWSFPTTAAAVAALDQMAGEGIGVLEHGRHLIVEPGAEGAALSLARGQYGQKTDLKLLSTFEAEGRPAERRLVLAEALGRAAREAHRRLYPPGPGPDGVVAGPSEHRRSAYSGIMVRSEQPPDHRKPA
jgi:aspartate kinase